MKVMIAILAASLATASYAGSKEDPSLVWPKNDQFRCWGTLEFDKEESLYKLQPTDNMKVWCDAYLASDLAAKVLKVCRMEKGCEIKGKIRGHGIFGWYKIESVRDKPIVFDF
jgi:hypothetical protein